MNPGETLAPGEAIRDHLILPNRIAGEARKRLASDEVVSISKALISEYEQDGWVVDGETKRKAKMRRAKRHDRAFEDRVWATFARLQFPLLNRDGSFKLQYGEAPNQAQQIDVFAADDEVILVIECKSTEKIQSGQFKKEIEAISGQRAGIVRRLRKEYPGRKVKFVLATNNFTISPAVGARLAQEGVLHFDEETISYYLGLADHLGAAAKYQLLGALFDGDKIPNLDPKVPAIKGTMGGHTYYSFAIEPARLLKLAYVLHRNQANSAMMPTYQRLIKKSRLKKVAGFVEDGGFFPNSLIINVDTGKKGKLQFDLAGKSESEAKLGLLHLPQTYRAAYIIDGQHRLYGYANSERAEKDLIPVVAFVDLPRKKQVELFMQINENQQAVPKNLRNTLNADLLYESEDYLERARALRLKIAQDLGDQKRSPLYGRVIVGENQRTQLRCITIDAISNGILRGNFVGTFTKTGLKKPGTFYGGDNKATEARLTPFLELAFAYFREQLETQWKLGGADGGFVFMNNGVEALVRILSDIVEHVRDHDQVNPLSVSAEEMLDACMYLVDPVIAHLEGLTPEEGLTYRTRRGSGGPATFFHHLQKAVRDAHTEFSPADLDDWLKAEDKQFVEGATSRAREIEEFIKEDLRKRLQDKFGADWEKQGIPRRLYVERGKDAFEKNADRPDDEQLALWDCMYLTDYEAILVQKKDLWDELFIDQYTPPGEENASDSWKHRVKWFAQLNKIRNDIAHARPVTEEDYAFLVDLHSWLVGSETS